jgi:xylulokinase
VTTNLLIGVDLGTSEVKATLFNQEGRARAEASRPIPLHQPGPGLAEQSPDDFYAATLAVLRAVVETARPAPGQVAAIGFSGQMAGAMGVDQQAQAMTPWYPSALDIRYQPYAAELARQAGSLLRARNGAPPFLAPRILWWAKEQPDLFRRLHKVVLLSTYIISRLAGLAADQAFIDPTYLCYTGLADTASANWSPELCEVGQVPPGLLPRVVACTEVVGRLSRAAADACGLPSGVPLVAGAGDASAAFLGAGIVEPGQLVDIAGTFCGLGACVNRFAADLEREMLVCFAGARPDIWYQETYISGGGLTHRWFRDQFGAEEKARAAEPDGDEAYRQLDRLAQQVPPGSDGLFFMPHLAGRACPEDPAVRGAWLGFSWTHTRAHFYRAVLEAIAYDYADTLQRIRAFFPELAFNQVTVVGGGGASEVWNQIKADVLGQPYIRLGREDMSTLGSAVIAGQAVGLFEDMVATVKRFTQARQYFYPRPERHAAYQPYVEFYRQLFDRMRPVYTELGRLSDQGQHKLVE